MHENGKKPLAGALLVALTWMATDASAQPGPAAAPPTAEEEAPTPYPACDTEPDELSTQGAQGAFQAGNASFNEADYPRAIFYWEDAYRRDCTAHAMLKNLARAYELNEQFEHAILALRTYLERTPESGESEAIQRRIENLERKLAERRAAAAPAEPEPEPERRKQTEAKPFVYDEDTEGYSEEEFDDGGGRSAVPLVFAGLGAGAGILGGLQWMAATSDAKQAEEDCGPGGRDMCTVTDPVTGMIVRNEAAIERGNEAVDQQILWGIVGGAGAALAVGGVIWYFAQDDGTEDDAARVQPEVGQGYAGVRFSGSF